MAFPTLTRNPKSVKVTPEENVIQSSTEAGYVHRRKKFTYTRNTYEVAYDLLPTADRDAINTHFGSVGMYSSFTWTDRESADHIVTYAKPPVFTFVVDGWYALDTLEFVEQ